MMMNGDLITVNSTVFITNFHLNSLTSSVLELEGDLLVVNSVVMLVTGTVRLCGGPGGVQGGLCHDGVLTAGNITISTTDVLAPIDGQYVLLSSDAGSTRSYVRSLHAKLIIMKLNMHLNVKVMLNLK